MKLKKNLSLPLDEFIDFSLYNKKFGYYMKKNPFGKKGDFITAPNISRLFSEMIALWVLSFWKNLGSPKKFNLIELGAGNGEMMKIIIETSKKFPSFFNSCKFIIHEKSPLLINIQKKKIIGTKIIWVNKITKLQRIPSVFIANEFFDSLAIKQFIKRKNLWYEKFINIESKQKSFIFEKKIDILKIKKRVKFNIFKNQNFVEYSELGLKYFEDICEIIKKNNGGLLLIDYGYAKKKMKNTLKAVSNHKIANFLSNIGNVDITHNINFELYKNFAKQIGELNFNLTDQKNFLLNMKIKDRAEIISQNKNFTEKANIYYRLNRLIDEKQMGTLFKVMLIKNKTDKFKLGFENDNF